jgi:outer membrane receptor for ferric coprogen and ferric-rhodotorulic acid
VDSYELGAKTEFLDNSLLLNATIFHQTFEGFQLNTFTGTSFVVTSIPEVVSRGVDADFLYLTPVEGLTVQGGVTYAETQFGDFVPGAGVSPRLPNARVSLAPLWSASLSGTYERPVAENLLARVAVNTKYSSSYNTGSDLNPTKVQEGFTIVNARVGLGTEDGRYSLELFAQNLFDEEYQQVAFDAPLQNEAGVRDAVNAFLGPAAPLRADVPRQLLRTGKRQDTGAARGDPGRPSSFQTTTTPSPGGSVKRRAARAARRSRVARWLT